MRYVRRESGVQVPRRAAMRERDRKGASTRVVYERERRVVSESTSEESASSESSRGGERGGRRKAPLFPFFTPR